MERERKEVGRERGRGGKGAYRYFFFPTSKPACDWPEIADMYVVNRYVVERSVWHYSSTLFHVKLFPVLFYFVVSAHHLWN